MFNWFHENFIDAGHELSIVHTCLTMGFATLYSYVIALAYRRTFEGKKYHANFAHSIVMLGSLVSLVIAVIGNSVARAFGVFGALSIIRYRVPIRDPKDIVYILASVVIGLACGVREYPEAGLATLFFVGLAWLLHKYPLGLEPDPAPPAKPAEAFPIVAPNLGAPEPEEGKHHKKHKHDKDKKDEVEDE